MNEGASGIRKSQVSGETSRGTPGVRPLFSGIGAALLTFFDDDGRLLVEACAEHAVRMVEAGCAAIVVAGTTGEASSLEAGERIALVSGVRAALPTAIPLLAGTGAPSAREAVTHTRAACDAGADAVLVLSPPHTADPRSYYDKVAKAAEGTPLLAYHFPQVSPPGVSLDQLLDLPVDGLKDSSGDAGRFLCCLERFGGDLWTGSPSLVLLSGAVGAAGAILALANLVPERCVTAWEGDVLAQRELAVLHETTYVRFPVVLKSQVSARYGTPTGCRLG